MNKREAIEELMSKSREVIFGDDENVYLSRKRTIELVSQIDEPQKPKVSQVAVEFYEKYKADILSLDEWFSDFYSDEAIEDFPRMEELTDWLHGNDSETNRQRELALATLVTLGIDAVEIEQEKLYTVKVLDSTLFKMTSDNHVRYKLIGENAIPSESKIGNYTFEVNLTEKEIKKADERLWEFAKPVEEN